MAIDDVDTIADALTINQPEPGGAASLAAMLKFDDGMVSAAIVSGGNIALGAFQQLTAI